MFGKKSILLIFLCILLISFVPAQDTITETIPKVYKQGTEFQFKEVCFNEGAFCSASTSCNATVTDPNGLVLVNNVPMTKTATSYNITFLSNQTRVLGLYSVCVTCNNGSNSGHACTPININPTGEQGSLIGLYVILFLVGYGLILFAWVIENKEVAIMGGMGLIILGVYTQINGIDVYQNLATQSIGIMTWAIGGIVAITILLEIFKENFG